MTIKSTLSTWVKKKKKEEREKNGCMSRLKPTPTTFPISTRLEKTRRNQQQGFSQ